MDERNVKAAMEQINVPKDKVFAAIDKGIKQRDDEQSYFSARKKWMTGTIAAVALFGGIAVSGFFNSSMNKVLASAPLIGKLYQDFGDSMGVNLAKQDLVTSLNQTATNNGITVKLTSAYFDGNVVSITGHVDGDVSGKNEEGEVSFDVNFEHNKGDHDPWLDGMSKDIKKKDNGYDFQWKLNYPYNSIEKNLILPISIHYINGVKGTWEFDIPISQKKFKTLAFNDQIKNFKDQGIKIQVKEMKIAQASSSFVYETTSTYKGDYINIYKAVGNNGKVLFQEPNNSVLSKSKEKDGYHTILRKTINKMDPDITSITFYPQLTVADPVANHTLNTKTFTLNSERTDMTMKINSIKQKGNKLTMDYQLLGFGDLSNHKFDIIKNNLGYEFTLIDKSYLGKIDPDNPVPPKNHSIASNKVTLLDKKTAHFQSVFILNGEERIQNFKLENTVLQFNFSSFIGVEKLEPFTVLINEK